MISNDHLFGEIKYDNNNDISNSNSDNISKFSITLDFDINNPILTDFLDKNKTNIINYFLYNSEKISEDDLKNLLRLKCLKETDEKNKGPAEKLINDDLGVTIENSQKCLVQSIIHQIFNNNQNIKTQILPYLINLGMNNKNLPLSNIGNAQYELNNKMIQMMFHNMNNLNNAEIIEQSNILSLDRIKDSKNLDPSLRTYSEDISESDKTERGSIKINIDEGQEKLKKLKEIKKKLSIKRGRNGKEITECPHSERKHYAKNMCYNCYHRLGRDKRAWLCNHIDKIHYARGLCQNCYHTLYKKSNPEAIVKANSKAKDKKKKQKINFDNKEMS